MDERVVIQRAKEGDELAWRWLYETHKAHVYAVVRRVVGNSHTVEDISQDAWLRIFRKIDLFELRSSFRTWVTKVAINVAYGSIRGGLHEEASDSDTVEPDLGSAPENLLLDHIVIQELLDRLPPGYRTVLVLRSEGFSHEEIAETLGIDPGTSRSQYHKGLASLRKLLGHPPKG